MQLKTLSLVLIVVGVLMGLGNLQNKASFQNLEGQSSGTSVIYSGQ